MDETTETGYREDCCFNDIRDQHPRHLPHGACKCRCHADYPERFGVTGRDRQTLLWVADDLRRTAEAFLKSADINPKRIERKHLKATASTLVERAREYERRAGAQKEGANDACSL